MKNAIGFFVVLMSFVISGKAQLSEESVIGSHAGMQIWEKCPVSIELKSDHVYEVRSFDVQLAERGVIRGRWRVEGDHVVLTDLLGMETILLKNGQECFLTARNGVSCIARFVLNKSISQYWSGSSKSGC